ncbi:MAG: hypothetical protein Q8T09_06100 [Candidatus Melainabacteria bacterium]|nr:hypothetical protein [Candidatus Melainabacteria bacterium]
MADGKLDQSVAPNEDTSNLKADVAAKFHEALNLPPAKTEPAKTEKAAQNDMSGLMGLAAQANNQSERTLGSLTSNLAQADARTKPESDDIFDSLAKNSKVARYSMAGVEGLAYAVPGALKAVAKDVSNPLELAAKVGVAASIGVVMKTVLPKAGVAKAVIGTVMAGYMVKDALHPIMNAMDHLETSSNDMASVHKAAQIMGDGVGQFAWDSWVGAKVGLKAEKWTGNFLEAKLGTTRYSNFEKAKVDFFSSDEHIVGRTLNSITRPISNVLTSVSERMTRKPEEPKVMFDEAVRKMAEVKEQNAYTTLSANMHFKGMATADAQPLGFSQSLDLLVGGHDPRKLSSNEAIALLRTAEPSVTAKPIDLTIRPNSSEVVPNNVVKSIIAPNDKPGHTPDELVPPTKPTDTDNLSTTGSTDKLEVTPAAAVGKPYTTKAEQELNVGTISKLAEMNTKEMKEWPDNKVLIADAVEASLGPIHAAITPSGTKMDPGFTQARNQAVSLGSQVRNEQDYRYIDPLLGRFSSAANQHISKGLSETANYKRELDLLAQEIHSTLVRNMKKAGVDPDQVLRSKNPPIFSIMHDGGAGPHTMRQIDGVWNVDHVLYPRNMVGVRSVTTSGIHGHEIGHDQYGGILKFEESIRENVIKSAVEKGLGTRAQDKVTVPGHGEMTKADLIEHIFKAQADENTADIWGAAWTGHNGGGALGILLQSLRKGGQLETRNVFGKEFVAPDNPLGFEVHAFDALRPKIVAATMRARANGDKNVLDHAKALDRYSDEASRPGDYVFANMDKPGETITITRKDLEDVIPHLIDAQMNTPLPALHGKTFGDILPDLPTHMAKMDNLAGLMVDAVNKGKKPNEIPFDTQHYSINQVFGAGMPAAMRLVAQGMDASEANKAVNKMSDFLRALYHDNDPHVDPLKPTTLQAIRLSSPKDIAASTRRVAAAATENTGIALGKTPAFFNGLGDRTSSLGGALGSVEIGSYIRNMEAQKQQEATNSANSNFPKMSFEPTAPANTPLKDRTLSNIAYMQAARKQILAGQPEK